MDAYRNIWGKCLNRLQEIGKELQYPTVQALVQEINTSYSNALPGLPRVEVPFLCVVNPTFGSSVLDVLEEELGDTNEQLEGVAPRCHIAHLHPFDALNLMSGMKALVSGFVDSDSEKVKRRAATSLAPYDISYLKAWYKASLNGEESHASPRPKLLILLHDFEQFEPSVLQDMLYICSLHVSEMPFVIVALLSSPASSSYMHISFSRATLSLLRIRYLSLPAGTRILETVFSELFFHPEFNPIVVFGPEFASFIADYFARYNSSFQGLISILQLAFMKHLTSHPLGLIAHDTPSQDQFGGLPQLDTLLKRLPHQNQSQPGSSSKSTRHQLATKLSVVDDARNHFTQRATRLRLAFHTLKIVQSYMESQGYKGIWDRGDRSGSVVSTMIGMLENRSGAEVKLLAGNIRKLQTSQLEELLMQLYTFFELLSPEQRVAEEDSRTKIVLLRSRLPATGTSNAEIQTVIGKDLGDWFTQRMSDYVVPLDRGLLWDVWYTGRAPFPLELINPSFRASMIAALLRPTEYTLALNRTNEEPSPVSLWELPDTSILFRRYLDSGKMINVYDWFESFQLVLETQRKKSKKAPSGKGASPTKARGKGKGKRQEVEDNEETEVQWRIEVQARFVRALQELDYLGFIKHTGRKADHVLRTVFDVGDS
ncbi:hypothetical protein BDN72DRAFT_454306 [Pluteus cervinus]|uniref:Uncharacterized protein n=1 Tax=Pluteus cervinus TaxID=181527 RepID=A0ACD3BDD1_9AGAR|nr:hypothetical protein BDN72DRAFT_454306 [Pluteus cervinus]